VKLIQTVTVGSGGTATIQFTNIPQTYTDLYLMLSGRTNEGTTISYVLIEPNSVSPGFKMLRGGGSSTASYSGSSNLYADLTGTSATSSTFSNIGIYISNYTSISTHKSMILEGVTENNATTASQMIVFGLLSSNNAITSINLAAADGNLTKNKIFLEYSSASLYGITKGSGGATAS
jgi:hypothetical protein